MTDLRTCGGVRGIRASIVWNSLFKDIKFLYEVLQALFVLIYPHYVSQLVLPFQKKIHLCNELITTSPDFSGYFGYGMSVETAS